MVVPEAVVVADEEVGAAGGGPDVEVVGVLAGVDELEAQRPGGDRRPGERQRPLARGRLEAGQRGGRGVA